MHGDDKNRRIWANALQQIGEMLIELCVNRRQRSGELSALFGSWAQWFRSKW